MKTKNDLLWSISLMAIGITALVLTGSGILGLTLPDAVIRILGAVDLIALPVLAFTTVRKWKKDRK